MAVTTTKAPKVSFGQRRNGSYSKGRKKRDRKEQIYRGQGR